jgi:hypothetical protein
MRTKLGVLVFGVAIIALASGNAAHAAGSKCTSAKFKASAKKVAAKAKCFGKVAGKGGTVDQGCLSKAETTFSAAFVKAEASADCLAPLGDAPTIEDKIDDLIDDVVSTVAGSPGGSFTGSKCNSQKITAAGKKASGKALCEAKATGKGVPVAASCLSKASTKFGSAISKAEGGSGCTHTGQAATLETKIDAFFDDLTRELTHTLAPGSHLSLSTVAGTTSCGSAGLKTGPSAPFSGEIDSDTAGTTKILDLGLGCLYIGGANATFTPPGSPPNGSSTFFDVSGGSTLLASDGTGPSDCSKGAGPGKVCVNDGTNSQCTAAAAPYPCCTGAGTGTCPRACLSDTDCAGPGSAGACQQDANCFFGPPQPIAAGGFSTCVLNVIATDGSGTVNTTTGDASLSLLLSSHVNLTGNNASPCPKCVSNKCTTGPNAGKSCTPVGTLTTSPACPPDPTKFTAALSVSLAPLTTGASSRTDAGGVFCPSQAHPGAFGVGNGNCTAAATPFACCTGAGTGTCDVQRISQTGSPAGNLTDMNPHAGIVGYNFCIPATGNAGVDAVADLPGPGSLGLNSSLQLH